MDVQLVDLDRIGGEDTQTRAALRPQAIAEYAEAIKAGEQMEPGVVFNDGAALHLAAGFHRREAHRLAGRTQMECEVREGTAWDAIQYGIRDNLKHRGERLTTADKAHNIKLVLRAEPELSNSAIAQLVGVSPTTVAKYRDELRSQIGESETRVGLDGRRINTANLGRPRNQPPEGGEGLAPVPDPHGEEDSPAKPSSAAIEPAKSSDHLFQEADRRFGQLMAILDELGNAKPRPCSERTMVTARKLGRWLDIWRTAG